MAGLLNIQSNSTLMAREAEEAAAAKAALERQNTPMLTSLASHVRKCWEEARDAKRPIETTMLKSLRQRKGEYEPDKLAAIRESGGSEIFMMVTETKCRGAESWLRDILRDEGRVTVGQKPTPEPELPPDFNQKVSQAQAQQIIQLVQSGAPIDPQAMEDIQTSALEEAQREVMEEATERAEAMQTFIRDQFTEGGMVDAFDAFISDLVTYPNAFLKGPTVRRVRNLQWAKGPDGSYSPLVEEKLAPTYSRVDPFRFYPEPGITRLKDGYSIEHHDLSESDLTDLIGVPGYDDEAIRALLAEGPSNDWMWGAEYTKESLENKYTTWRTDVNKFGALEFWGRVSGKLLREWGLSSEDVPDIAAMYDANVWLVGSWVIKATLNYDPLGDKPYRTTSFIKLPGAFWGRGVPELIEDVQAMCNAAARALSNNMGIASGPQVEVTADRLAPGEKITQMYPWKIWQTVSDPMGSGRPAINFMQPDDRSGPLMQVYQQFARMADEQSGIPAYMYGDGQVGGAGRTSSGLSMLMGSAGKGIRQVIMHIDFDAIGPTVTSQYNWNMQYVDRPDIKGDCEIVPRGAVTLANREQLNVRRVEFLQATANPIDAEIVGMPGRAAILREVAKGLSMPVDDIVPSKDALEAKEAIKQAMEQQAAMAGAGPQQVQVMHSGGGDQATTVDPAGNPAGGQAGNTASNRMTGRGG
jgi:hypothetical protein